MTRVLVCAAHPDDEILGVGATVARHVRAGDVVETVIAAEGETSRGVGSATASRLEELRGAAARAAEVLGAAPPRFLGYPDNRMDTVPLLEVAQAFEAVIRDVEPNLVYTHSPGDLNVDHRRVHDAIMTVCRPQPVSTVREIRLFETVSSTGWDSPSGGGAFHPALFVDVSDTLAAKLDALRAYEIEMRPWPHARSMKAVEHLARWRGASVGLDAAEAFELARRLL